MCKQTKRLRWLAGLIACAVLLTVAGCNGQGSTSGSSEGGEKVSGEWALPELKNLNGNTLTMLVANGGGLGEEIEQLLKTEYGLTVDYIEVPWNETTTKLAALVVSNSSPDVFGKEPQVNFISGNLIQPVDDYVDWSHKYYDKYRSFYEENIWNGKHYGLYNSVYVVNGCYYNKKLFNDAGLESPWDLYLQDKWDWDAFAEAAENLTQDTNDDGEVDVYGFAFNRPIVWPYVTGETFAKVDGANLTIESNMYSQNLARAMNYIFDLIDVKHYGSTEPTAIELFAGGGSAMLLHDNKLMYSYLKDMIANDTLGAAPMPRDPQQSKYYARDMVSAITIPVGAKNPQAAVALNAVMLYNTYYKPNALEDTYAKIQQEYGMSDTLIEQLRTIHGETGKETNIAGVHEGIEDLGYNLTWHTIYWGIPWATALENNKAEMDSMIAAALDDVSYDPPSGEKIIENFESIYVESLDKPIVSKLLPIAEGSKEYELYLDAEVKHGGNYSGKLYYNVDDIGWGGFRRNVNKTWNTNNTLSLWAQGDGTQQQLTITFVDGSNVAWSYSLEITGTEGKVYEIPFTDFTPPAALQGEGVEMNLSNIATIQFAVKGQGAYAGLHQLNLDDVQAVSRR